MAAPTAGLHFTSEILDQCRTAGAQIAYVTLHVGLGTFQPIHSNAVEQVRLHAEDYSISEENAARINAARRVIAVGTTSVRTTESAARSGAFAQAAVLEGQTDLFIYPGFRFKRTGAPSKCMSP